MYDELRKLAAARMARAAPGQTLQPTALVHEAWLRLTRAEQPQHWNSRGHFFAAAAEAMRRILVERARRRSTEKHGGGLRRVDLDQVDIAEEANCDLLLAVDEALTGLAERDPTAAQLIKLRFFAHHEMSLRVALSCSNSAHQKQDNQNNQNQAHSAARVVSPTPAVRPRRECAEQHQNKQNH